MKNTLNNLVLQIKFNWRFALGKKWLIELILTTVRSIHKHMRHANILFNFQIKKTTSKNTLMNRTFKLFNDDRHWTHKLLLAFSHLLFKLFTFELNGSEIFVKGSKLEKKKLWKYQTHAQSLFFCFCLTLAPDPPSNLSVSVRSGKSAVISLSPPPKGNYSSFKLRVSAFSDEKWHNCINLIVIYAWDVRKVAAGTLWEKQLKTYIFNSILISRQ